MIDRPVFVVGNLKSGTTLLQSLLDGHPDLLVVPAELKVFKFAGLPTLPPGNLPPPPLPSWHVPLPRPPVSADRVLRDTVGHGDLARLLEGEPLPRNVDVPEAAFDRRAFRRALEAASPEDLRGVYAALFRAFHAGFGDDRPVSSVRFVEKTPHLEEFARELAGWFPDARFLHVLRNPYANLHSLQKGTRRKRDLGGHFYRPTAKSHYFLERNRRHLDGYRVLRYEDLVLETEATMRSAAEFLGIPYDPRLERPTFAGRPWGGNPRSVDGELVEVDPRPVDAFEEEIAPLHVALVNRFFPHLMEKYGYERRPDPGISQWLPLRWETPWDYLRNRRLLSARHL